MQADAGFFRGEERLELFEGLGYSTRKGAPRSLAVSDRRRVEQAINARSGALALAYLDTLAPRHREMLELLFEWCLQCLASALVLTSGPEERVLTVEALARFAGESASLGTDATKADWVEQVTDRLARAMPEDAARLRREKASGGPQDDVFFVRALAQRLDALKGSLSHGDWDGARAHLDAYFACCVTLHDALVTFTFGYPAAALATRGTAFALALVRHSFSSLSAYEGLFALPRLLAPEALAAFLAEHLRSHFSGPDRGGSVLVEEDEDSYRLIFDPCGSGGALRRRLDGRWQGALVPEAVPMTWMRAREVPVYCAHCAFNELVLIERFGYPVLVTAFDPDPSRPCGWTVYKRPEAVPESCYRRLGQPGPGRSASRHAPT